MTKIEKKNSLDGNELPSKKKKKKLTRVLMSLKHQLSLTSMRIPKLDPPILRARQHPIAILGQSHTEHKVLVALKRAQAPARPARATDIPTS